MSADEKQHSPEPGDQGIQSSSLSPPNDMSNSPVLQNQSEPMQSDSTALPQAGTDQSSLQEAYSEPSANSFVKQEHTLTRPTAVPAGSKLLTRDQASDLAVRLNLPTPTEIENAIPEWGISMEDLLRRFRSQRKGIIIDTHGVKSPDTGTSQELHDILSVVAKWDDHTQLIMRKDPDSPPSLPEDLLPDSGLSEIEYDLQLIIHWRLGNFSIRTSQAETIKALAGLCAEHIEADLAKVKLFVMPGSKVFRYPFPDTPLKDLVRDDLYFKLVAATSAENQADGGISGGRVGGVHRPPPAEGEEAINGQGNGHKDGRANRSSPRGGSGVVKSATPARTRDWKQIQEESTYTFHSIKPLPYLPNPEKSQRFLERLASDPGIKASMRKHKFSVGLLTEMNPADHTTHESRTLGLNRNRGEVIELRLRTDRYDGYRDYKVIRKTLCHELSHNVWGDHDRNFWDLTKQIEQEVEQNDWKHGGHRLTNEEFYNPDDDGADADHADAGGWTGGQFVLGGISGRPGQRWVESSRAHGPGGNESNGQRGEPSKKAESG